MTASPGRFLLALALVSSTAVLASSLARPAKGALQTTAPSVTYTVDLTLTNSTILVSADKFSKGSKYPRYPRGASIRYDVTDKGTRPYSIKIGSHVTPVIDPGHSMLVHVQWTVRGQFLYETLYQGKPLGPKGYVTVF